MTQRIAEIEDLLRQYVSGGGIMGSDKLSKMAAANVKVADFL